MQSDLGDLPCSTRKVLTSEKYNCLKAMKQTDEVRYCTPVHEVRVRSYGNLCPSDCGNRSLTGHADSAVCNERQVPLVSTLQWYNCTKVPLVHGHFTISNNSTGTACWVCRLELQQGVVTECKNVPCAYLNMCSFVCVCIV